MHIAALVLMLWMATQLLLAVTEKKPAGTCIHNSYCASASCGCTLLKAASACIESLAM
jgi:hypothetical protein